MRILGTQSPQPIKVPAGTKQIQVEHEGPVLRDEVIGHIPSYNYTPGNFPVSFAYANDEVVRGQPVLDAQGQPQMERQSSQLDLQPYSPVGRALTRGLLGASLAGVAAAAISLVASPQNLVPIAATAATTGAVAGAVYGAKSVQGDRVSAEWELTPVTRHHFDGYTTQNVPTTQLVNDGEGQSHTETTGCHHYYYANVSQQPVEDFHFWQPVVRHSSDR